jgi:hypothetical protein
MHLHVGIGIWEGCGEKYFIICMFKFVVKRQTKVLLPNLDFKIYIAITVAD